MKKWLKHIFWRTEGQGMSEYGIILGAIGLSVVVILGVYGGEIGQKFTDVTDMIMGSFEQEQPEDEKPVENVQPPPSEEEDNKQPPDPPEEEPDETTEPPNEDNPGSGAGGIGDLICKLAPFLCNE